jgi:hypothetical protein
VSPILQNGNQPKSAAQINNFAAQFINSPYDFIEHFWLSNPEFFIENLRDF